MSTRAWQLEERRQTNTLLVLAVQSLPANKQEDAARRIRDVISYPRLREDKGK